MRNFSAPIFIRTSAFLVAGMLTSAGPEGFAEDDAPRFSSWFKIESATETKAYKEAMRSGGALDANSRGFLETIALPQLELPGNRPTIERVRKRMRELLLAEITDQKAAEDAIKTFSTFLEALVNKDEADPVVRVNAMLLIGELQGVSREPWPPAAPLLATAFANTKLSDAIRIAAGVGLARHVEATKGLAEEQQRIGSVATPAILSILKSSGSPESAVETDWLVSRSLAILPLLGPLSPEMALEIVRILGDGQRSINVRVRAAAALAIGGGEQSKIDGAAAIESIGPLAIALLESEIAVAERSQFDRQPGGVPGGVPGGFPGGVPGGVPGGFPGDPSTQPPTTQSLIPREACRRAAWRLATLADAILSDDSKRGLALLENAPSPAARALSQKLRRAALELDATPEETVLRQALTDLKPPAPPAAQANPPETAGAKN